MDTLQFKKHFTPAEATRMLPLVRRIVEDIQEQGHLLQDLKKSEHPAEERQKRISRQISTVNGFFTELEDLGCFYKGIDFDTGMIDFPGIIDGEEVFLCWKSDEERLSWFHPIDEGFKGRREIPAELLDPETTDR
jgi:hypothetical protein